MCQAGRLHLARRATEQRQRALWLGAFHPVDDQYIAVHEEEALIFHQVERVELEYHVPPSWEPRRKPVCRDQIDYMHDRTIKGKAFDFV